MRLRHVLRPENVDSVTGIEIDGALQSFMDKSLKTTAEHGDITTIGDVAQLPGCDGFQFSPPCIAFSVSGNHEGEEHASNPCALVEPCLAYIGHHLPKVFVNENVAGIKR